MAAVKPNELTVGPSRGVSVTGRVRMLSTKQQSGKDVTELHLIVEPGLSGMVFVEGWRENARRLLGAAEDGKMPPLVANTHIRRTTSNFFEQTPSGEAYDAKCELTCQNRRRGRSI